MWQWTPHVVHHSMTTVLMGFNPPELARNMPVDGWDKTCRGEHARASSALPGCLLACADHKLCPDVALALESASDANNILLTPVVGPEPITGSTRMKGGSATKIMLVWQRCTCVRSCRWRSYVRLRLQEVVFGVALRRLYVGFGAVQHRPPPPHTPDLLSAPHG